MSRMSEIDECVSNVDDVLGDMERLMGGIKRRPLEDLVAVQRGMATLNARMSSALALLGEALLLVPPRS